MKKTIPVRKSRNEKIFLTLSNSKWFQKECTKVRKEYKKRDNDELYLLQETKRLCQLLPAYWQNSIFNYIKNDKLIMPELDGAQIVYTQDNLTNERVLYIRIFQKTNKDNVLKLWKQVKKFQKWLPEIWAPDQEDNLVIYDVWNEVNSRENKPRNIAREVSNILQEEHKISLGESDIRKRISLIKKQLRAGEKQG